MIRPRPLACGLDRAPHNDARRGQRDSSRESHGSNNDGCCHWKPARSKPSTHARQAKRCSARRPRSPCVDGYNRRHPVTIWKKACAVGSPTAPQPSHTTFCMISPDLLVGPVSSLSFTTAGPADSFALVEPGIGLVERMTVPAMSLVGLAVLPMHGGTAEIDRQRHRVQVIWVHAVSHATQVVDGETIGDRAHEKFVGQSMHQSATPIAVAVGGAGACPNPTGPARINAIPERLRLHRTSRRRIPTWSAACTAPGRALRPDNPWSSAWRSP